ncbi:hypothetical protein BDZ88DRAFT_454941 [Geranomyces variabilis]|nr:hypothetical protein BDZ88DRAFT_454941 [Geranomyces variabilis]KAJ3138533.1 hypothetical protein HDU90_000974 [Geranomyces variabilis]
MTVSTLEDRIAVLRPEHDRLLATLSETSHAASSVSSHLSTIQDLRTQLASANSHLQAVTATRRKKESIQQSQNGIRRLAFRVVGKDTKHDAKAEQERLDFEDVTNREAAAKLHRDSLLSTLQAAEQTKTDLQSVAQLHDATALALDTMYDTLFSGPTPSEPSEDLAESSLSDALSHLHRLTAHYEAESAAVWILQYAIMDARNALRSMEQAVGVSAWDVYAPLSGFVSNGSERALLREAREAVARIHGFFLQAAQKSGAVVLPPEMRLPQGHLLAEGVHNTFSGDIRMEEAHFMLKQGAMHVVQERTVRHSARKT